MCAAFSSFPNSNFFSGPWDTSKTPTDWIRIKRPVYSNDALLQMVETVPRLVDNRPEDQNDTNTD